MSTGAITGIIIAVLIVAAIVVIASAELRRARMRRQFGPEYDRLAKQIGPRKADAELAARQRRVEALGIHPLSAQQQARYNSDWATVQERFVNSPAEALSAASRLIWDVMRDRGYPADDRNASMEALSVYHAGPLDGYRQAQGIRADSASTEELRGAFIRCRALFEDLLGAPAGRARLARGAGAGPVRGAGNYDTVAADGRLAAEDRSFAAGDRSFAAGDRDRTADTPR